MKQYRQNADLSDFHAVEQESKSHWLTDFLWACLFTALVMAAPALMW